MKKYLREHMGSSGGPVVLMHHYGFDGFSTNDWNWWTARQRRAYYDALEGYNVAAILHGHDHHAAHYRWPNPQATPDEARRQFGDNPPRSPHGYDVFSCGTLSGYSALPRITLLPSITAGEAPHGIPVLWSSNPWCPGRFHGECTPSQWKVSPAASLIFRKRLAYRKRHVPSLEAVIEAEIKRSWSHAMST